MYIRAFRSFSMVSNTITIEQILTIKNKLLILHISPHFDRLSIKLKNNNMRLRFIFDINDKKCYH